MERVVAKIKKSGANEVWVAFSDFTGELRLDIREHFHAGASGAQATRKGISIPLEEIPALRNALDALAAATELGTVASLHRTKRVEVQAGLRKFEGHTYAELRMFTPGPSAEAPWRPTPKGFTLRQSLVPLLADAVGEAEDLVDDVRREARAAAPPSLFEET